MNARTTALLALALAVGSTACEPTEPTIPSHVIVIPESYDSPFNAESGDVLILVMTPDSTWVDRCNQMGGEPILNTRTLIATCEDVDF